MIILKGLLVVKNCFRPESVPLIFREVRWGARYQFGFYKVLQHVGLITFSPEFNQKNLETNKQNQRNDNKHFKNLDYISQSLLQLAHLIRLNERRLFTKVFASINKNSKQKGTLEN